MTARVGRARMRLLGSGVALPGRPVSNDELLEHMESNFQVSARPGRALARRLGVNHRHFCREWQQRRESPRAGQRNPELAAGAVLEALGEAKLAVGALQYLIGHTTTPARPLPPNIAEVASLIGHATPYAELRQACTGFANVLQWADAMLSAPNAAPLAIVGSETGSVFFDPAALHEEPDQWVNLMQMGDGAGAVVLGADDGLPGPHIESAFFGHIGLGRPSGFSLDDGGSDHPYLRDGRAVTTFRQDFAAVKEFGAELFQAGFAAACEAGVDPAGLAAIIPHQANGKIGAWLAPQLGLPAGLFFGNAEHVGNLGSAAIWVALHELRRSSRLHAGDRVLVLGAEATQYLYGGFVYVHA